MNFDRVTIEQFFRTYSVSSFAVSEDERQIAFSTNLTGKYDVWSMSPNHPYPAQLTTLGQLPHDIQFSPRGDYLLVAFDTDGDENAQLYAVAPNGGSLKPLRIAHGRRFMGARLRKDGKHVYYCSDKDNHSFLNGYVYDIDTGEERVIYEGANVTTHLGNVAPDESSFVTLELHANTYSVAYLHEGDKVTCLTPDQTVVHATFTTKYHEDKIYLATNFDSEFFYFASFTPATGEFKKLYTAEGNCDVASFEIDKQANQAVLLVSGGVEDRLIRYDLETGATGSIDAPFKSIDQLEIGGSGTLYVLGQSDIRPRNVYGLEAGSTSWNMLTNNRIIGVSDEELSEAEVVTYPSFDGLEIEGLIFPANPANKNGFTVVWPHGGPQAAERKFYRAFFQYLTYSGYDVFAPNFRGSSGYGATFMKMVEGDWGHGPRLDMIEGIEWLIQQGRADREKLFLVGGSYGGYMTLLLHGRHADYFKACVDIFGPSNLFTFSESVPDHWKPMMRPWLGDPVEDKDRFVADSPITYLAGMTKPMLVIQGANDPRVVKAESDQIVAALREQGTEIEYIVFDDEGHGFSKKGNEIHAYGSAVAFLDKHRGA
ncbi:S9 family peptidase [Alicyclobacillus dauci]|uniref:S9 family peptidase n=1 Tax=Alicyclobacillus dauci TaxID=1475485 RepID=A0ABY6Z5B1_9BACL|nr:S9 family peptidase [Alicyclobacillus dauci]WAH37944.1 S9 family peptidase [Alicyclobacillus dauci]